MGKSYLIHTIAQWADKILREGNGRDDPDMPTVLLLAYTGVAANNIGNISATKVARLNITTCFKVSELALPEW